MSPGKQISQKPREMQCAGCVRLGTVGLACAVVLTFLRRRHSRADCRFFSSRRLRFSLISSVPSPSFAAKPPVDDSPKPKGTVGMESIAMPALPAAPAATAARAALFL